MKARDILASIVQLPLRVVSWVKERIQVYKERQKELAEHAEYIQQVESMDSTFIPETPDVELGERCKEYLANKFPQGIQESIDQLSKEELLELFEQITKDAIDIIDVEIEVIDFYSDENFPQNVYCGYYCNYDKSIHINAAFILSGDTYLITEQVYTIFHELKHARQWAAVLHEKDYGYSEEQVHKWGENFLHYIPSIVCDETYRKQPVEFDAFGFESIVKGEYNVNQHN